MARALVTGASGFVGMHVVQALRSRGDEVVCLLRKMSNVEFIEPLGVELVYGDVTDRDSVVAAAERCEVVYHVAGCVKALEWRTMFDVNARGALNVAAACARQESPPTLIAVSSLAAAGPAKDHRPRAEDEPEAPVSTYGRTKLAGERAIPRYADRVPITIVRPGIVFGEGDRGTLELFQQIKRMGIHFSPGFRRKPYSIIHAADLASLMLSAAERGERLPARGEAAPVGRGVYFASSDRMPTFQEIGDMIGQAMGRERVGHLPSGPAVLWTTAAISEWLARRRGQASSLNRDKAREALAGAWIGSNAKACVGLRYKDSKPLQERFDETAVWYREHDWL